MMVGFVVAVIVLVGAIYVLEDAQGRAASWAAVVATVASAVAYCLGYMMWYQHINGWLVFFVGVVVVSIMAMVGLLIATSTRTPLLGRLTKSK